MATFIDYLEEKAKENIEQVFVLNGDNASKCQAIETGLNVVKIRSKKQVVEAIGYVVTTFFNKSLQKKDKE